MKIDHKTVKLHAFLALAGFSIFSTPTFAADLEQGKKLFAERCSSCHGALGQGDGPVAAALPPEMKPRNLATVGSWKFATDDTKFRELLKKGGAAVGLNPLMPAQADLSDADAGAVMAYVHSLKK